MAGECTNITDVDFGLTLEAAKTVAHDRNVCPYKALVNMVYH